MTSARPAAGSPRSGQYRPLLVLLAIGWGGYIWYLSSGVPRIGGEGFHWRILTNGGHAVLFGVLATLLLGGLPAARVARLAGAALASLYGVVDEWHQSLVPGRQPSLADWVTDSCGVLLGWALIVLLETWLAEPERRATRAMRLGLAALACVVAAILASL